MLFVTLLSGMPQNASAGYLTISGKSEFVVHSLDKVFKIEGEYSIQNSGDETAINVFPEFQIGTWIWAGDPQSIKANSAATWKIDLEVPKDKFTCSADARCAALALSVRGSIPLIVLRNYQDTNGYAFSAPEVIPLALGPLTQEEHALLRTHNIESLLSVRDEGDVYQFDLSLYNPYESETELALSFHTARELRILTRPMRVRLGPGERKTVLFKAENFKGRIGSRYAVFAVIQHSFQGLRLAQAESNIVQIVKTENVKTWLWFGSFLLLSILISLYFFVFKGSEKKTTK